jgi:hypothetical protein
VTLAAVGLVRRVLLTPRERERGLCKDDSENSFSIGRPIFQTFLAIHGSTFPEEEFASHNLFRVIVIQKHLLTGAS